MLVISFSFTLFSFCSVFFFTLPAKYFQYNKYLIVYCSNNFTIDHLWIRKMHKYLQCVSFSWVLSVYVWRTHLRALNIYIYIYLCMNLFTFYINGMKDCALVWVFKWSIQYTHTLNVPYPVREWDFNCLFTFTNKLFKQYVYIFFL